MRILLAAATPFEISKTLEQLSSGGVPVAAGSATARDHATAIVDHVITGVGLVSATYHLQRAIVDRRPDLVIQAGIAGCFDPSIPLGSVVVVDEEVIADLGVEENGEFKDLFDLNLLDAHQPPYTGGRLINPYVKRFHLPPYPVGAGISVSEISTRPERIAFLKQRYHPLVESMEGAALHFVCLQEKVPFLQIRSLSNYIGERDKRRWQLAAALSQLGEALHLLLASTLNTGI
jgi:futalosine hydrolase